MRTGFVDSIRAHQTEVIACLGYALFLATNATVVWGGVFPFLPLETQTPAAMTLFFAAQASVFALYYFASVVRAYRRPASAREFHVVRASIPYLAGWALLIAVPYVSWPTEALTTGGGALIGYGAASFFFAWQRLFTAQKPAVANTEIIVGNIAAAGIYFALYLIPRSVTALLAALVFLPLFALCIVLTGRSVDLGAAPFCDVPREHPHVYRLVVKDYWRIALCMGAVAFSCGEIRALAVEKPEVASIVNIASMLALLITALAFLTLWRTKVLHLNASIFFRALFPVLATAFVALPLLGGAYLNVFAAALYAVYGCATILAMIQCAQTARDRSINPAFVYGFVAGIMYALHDVGFLFGSYAQTAAPFGMDPLVSTSLIAIYVLCIMFFVAQGGIKAALSPNHLQAGRIELVITGARGQRVRPTPGAGGGNAAPGGGEGAEVVYADKTAKQCALVQAHFKLSKREGEIVEALVRGNTVGAIAEQLGVSENTVRTHTKHIYTRLDIHKKQQLVELVRTFDPEALNTGGAR